MPQRHQPPTLLARTLYQVCRHFEYLCYGVRDRRVMAAMLEDGTYLACPGPFLQCPTRVLEGLLSTLPNVPSVRHVQTRHLHVLLQPQLHVLSLTAGTGHVHSALDLLRVRRPRLRRLDISYLRTVEPPLLLGVFPLLPHLTHLNLAHTEANDSVLSAVGQHCQQLRDINVSCCPISDKGLARLFWDSHQKRATCQQVTAVNILGCQVSPFAVAEALRLRPPLQLIEFENSFLAFDPQHGNTATAGWQQSGNSCQPTSFAVRSLTASGSLVTDVAMGNIVELCSSLTSLTLDSCQVSCGTLLQATQLAQLTQLRLTNASHDGLDFLDAVSPLLTVAGERLTCVLLTAFCCVDVSLVGATCPNLEQLALSDVALYVPVGPCPSAGSACPPFSRLQALEVWSSPTNASLTGAVLLLLLRHCGGLRNLLLSGAACLTDGLLLGVWTEDNPMKELCRLTLDSCPGVSAEPLEFLLLQENDLSLLRVWGCFGVTKADEGRLKGVISAGNLDVYFEWFGWQG